MAVAGHFQRSNETIPSTRNSLDKTRFLGGVVQSLPQLIDRVIQIVVEIDKRIVKPQALVEFVARDQSPGALQQGHENLKGFFLQLDSEPQPSYLASFKINLERGKTQE